MFTPLAISGRIFKQYLKGFKHPAKIRMQNLIGRSFFDKDMRLQNTDGVVFSLDPNDWITRIILLEGDYEAGSTMLAKKILHGGGSFIDIGANFGLFTCMVAYNNKEVKVMTIEPNYKMIARLLNNIRLNGLQDRVRVFNTAISRDLQFVTLQQPADNNMGTTVTSATANGELSILSCSLDQICEQHGNEAIDLVKIDIEGNEFEIFENFSFQKYTIKNIILEFNHLSKISFKQLIYFFEGKGFKSFTVFGEPLQSEQQSIPDNNIWFVNQHVS